MALESFDVTPPDRFEANIILLRSGVLNIREPGLPGWALTPVFRWPPVFPSPIPSQVSASNKNRSPTIYVTIDPDDATLESAAKDRSA
jgi:hypothetical protein